MTLKHYLIYLIFYSLLFVLTACRSTSPPSWQWERAETGLPRQVITLAVAADLTNPDRLWLGTYAAAGLARSEDGGQTWTSGAIGLADNPIFDLLFTPPPAPAGDGEIGGILWAATRDGLLRSVDAGAQWQLMAEGLPPSPVFALAADARGRVYAGLDEAGIYVQRGTGGWESLNPLEQREMEELASAAVLSLAVSPDGQQLYAGTADRGVFASQDGGRTWLNTYPDNYVPNLALNPSNPAQAVASLRRQLVRTGDGGRSWQVLPVAWAQEEILSLLWLENGALGAATGQGRLYRSLDGGESWLEGGAGLPRGSVLDLAAVESPASRQLWAATWTGLYGSEDGGESWRYLTPALGNPNAQALLTTEAGLLLGTRAGLFRWQPDTHRWEEVPGGFPAGGVASLSADPGNPQVLYAGTSGDGLYRSDDGGANWQRVPALGVGVPAVAVDPKDSQRAYILAAWERVYASQDGGQSWQARWQGLGDTLETASLAVDPLKPNVYVGTETGLYRSHQHRFWRPVAPALADQTILALLAQSAPTSAGGGTVLYLGTTRGIYRSLDGGASVQGGGNSEGWREAGQDSKRRRSEERNAWGRGLENISVTALLADPHNPSQLYAGTAYAGVYQSSDWGHTWQPIGPAEVTEDVIEGLAWGPEGDLFVAAATGVWVGVRQ